MRGVAARIRKLLCAMLALLLWLTACTAESAPSEQIPSEQTGSAEKRLAEALATGETALLWEIEDTELPAQSAAVYRYDELELLLVWQQVQQTLFPNAEVISSETVNDGSELLLTLACDGVPRRVNLLKSSFSIETLSEQDAADCAERLRGMLEEQTGLTVSEIPTDGENGYLHQYAFLLEGVPVDPVEYGYYSKSDDTYLPVINVMEGNITVSRPIKAEEKTEMIALTQCLSVEELRLLCTVQWETTGLPILCVLEDITLVYIRDVETKELIPAWRLDGRFYELNETQYSRAMCFLINAETGEIIQFM